VNTIEIRDGALRAVIYPDYGGMLGRLTLGGVEVLHLNEARLSQGAVLAGGNPVLFPFPSRTQGDRYELDGRSYRMPFHGLVRDSAFGVEAVHASGATLVRTGCPEWRRDLYPFDFTLRLDYQLEGGALRMTALVENGEDRPMPHAFGWHPYFTTTDKARARVSPNMAFCERWDDSGKVSIPPDGVEIARPADYVMCGRTGDTAEIVSPADGYGARIRSCDAFRALVVCTLFPGTTCVEPWIALPNAANTRKDLAWVPPYSKARYDCFIEPYLL
jgi:galactose mutarotase-like enzyme